MCKLWLCCFQNICVFVWTTWAAWQQQKWLNQCGEFGGGAIFFPNQWQTGSFLFENSLFFAIIWWIFTKLDTSACNKDLSKQINA